MKLKEFIDFTKCEDLFIINEIHDTHIPIDKWERDGEDLVGTLTVNDETYQIKLEPLTYTTPGLHKTALNVTFAKLINGVPSENLTFDNKSASKVLGAVINGVFDVLPNMKYDALVFAATDNVDKRMRIHNKAADRVMRKFPKFGVIKNVKFDHGEATVLLPPEVAQTELELLRQHILK